MIDGPEIGDVWSYPYLWAWQAAKGGSEGRKTRPCAVTISVQRKDGLAIIYLLSITSKQPDADRHPVEIPQIERKRARLAADMPLWVIVDEVNSDIPERSYYLEPDGLIGRFSTKFTRELQAAFLQNLKRQTLQTISRQES